MGNNEGNALGGLVAPGRLAGRRVTAPRPYIQYMLFLRKLAGRSRTRILQKISPKSLAHFCAWKRLLIFLLIDASFRFNSTGPTGCSATHVRLAA